VVSFEVKNLFEQKMKPVRPDRPNNAHALDVCLFTRFAQRSNPYLPEFYPEDMCILVPPLSWIIV
jgi:hypothetical protein